jgi:hypothetical protein
MEHDITFGKRFIIDRLVAEIVAGSNNPSFDLTNDNLVNINDQNRWLLLAGEHDIGPGRPYLPGDANASGSAWLVLLTVDGLRSEVDIY